MLCCPGVSVCVRLSVRQWGRTDADRSAMPGVELPDQYVAKFWCGHRLLAGDQFAINDDVAVPVRHRVHVCTRFSQGIDGIELHVAAKTRRTFKLLFFTVENTVRR